MPSGTAVKIAPILGGEFGFAEPNEMALPICTDYEKPLSAPTINQSSHTPTEVMSGPVTASVAIQLCMSEGASL
ncbi:hypothetical protein ONV78_08145, partial [Hahella sp. CR1]|uniref:hypothetical protein n=1 Tax=Hahella sp. CR1 TaxID=2992807 RepID=UPI002441A0EE